MQNVGTIGAPGEMQRLFALHATSFGAVFAMFALVPDYLGPYILVLSSVSELSTEKVDWEAWERYGIPTQYYAGGLGKSLSESFRMLFSSCLKCLF